MSSPAPYTIRRLSDGDEAAWDAFLDTREEATLYHRARWRRLIRALFGHEGWYLYASGESGEILGVLPLIRLRSRLFGDYLVSMPYVNYGGAIGVSQDIEHALMHAACEQAKQAGVRHIEFRDIQPRSGEWGVRTDKVVMELVLPSTPEALWDGFTPKLRAQIRRPQRERTEVFRGGMELLPDFYRVFARNMRDLGTPVYAYTFFSAILKDFPAAARIVLVRHQQRPVAAAFLLGDGERLEIPWASSLREYNQMGVNMLLYWEVLRGAIEGGYRVFDFGRSSLDSGTYRFKKQWGAQPRQLYWHYWLADGQAMPQLTPSSPKYQMAIRMWKRLPVFVANRLGPYIVKNLP
jgi:FemAB-related protein (PEP-CTERM system-associated)